MTDKELKDMGLFERAKWYIEEGSSYNYSETKECLKEVLEYYKSDKVLNCASPLIEYLAREHHPHVTAIVTSTSVEILEGIESRTTHKYVDD